MSGFSIIKIESPSPSYPFGTALEKSDVATVIDDNTEKWGTQGNGDCRIDSPADLARSGVDIVLIASNFFEDQMRKNVERWVREHGRQYQEFCPHCRAVLAVSGQGASRG